jgi:hypothetical protein
MKLCTFTCHCLVQEGHIVVTKKDKEPLNAKTIDEKTPRENLLLLEEIGQENAAIKESALLWAEEGQEVTLELKYLID